jgi:hypothetical protein
MRWPSSFYLHTDCKIVASALLRILIRNSAHFIHPGQYGLRRKPLLDCFFQIESRLPQASATSPAPVVGCFDYSNAFPSHHRPYL